MDKDSSIGEFDKDSGIGKSIYQLIQEMENPFVRVEDVQPYVVNSEVLGILYGYVAGSVPKSSSPGLMLLRHPTLSEEVQLEFQKRFQIFTRNFLHDRVGDLVLRKKKAEDFRNFYHPGEIDERSFADGSVEFLVAEYLGRDEFTQLGERLKAGAKAYQHKADRRNTSRYRYASEYSAIRDALRR